MKDKQMLKINWIMHSTIVALIKFRVVIPVMQATFSIEKHSVNLRRVF